MKSAELRKFIEEICESGIQLDGVPQKLQFTHRTYEHGGEKHTEVGIVTERTSIKHTSQHGDKHAEEYELEALKYLLTLTISAAIENGVARHKKYIEEQKIVQC